MMALAYLEVRTASAVCIWSSQGGSSICLDPWIGYTPSHMAENLWFGEIYEL